MLTLREGLLKLANENPEMRRHLLPMLASTSKEAGSPLFVMGMRYQKALMELRTMAIAIEKALKAVPVTADDTGQRKAALAQLLRVRKFIYSFDDDPLLMSVYLEDV